ncbi:hypothetical protein B0H11DRAFT_1930614 [Mycena galericulata]|nr:hypothetical protein B0H11DRAFT_1930614 [Mycena galericulata]
MTVFAELWGAQAKDDERVEWRGDGLMITSFFLGGGSWEVLGDPEIAHLLKTRHVPTYCRGTLRLKQHSMCFEGKMEEHWAQKYLKAIPTGVDHSSDSSGLEPESNGLSVNVTAFSRAVDRVEGGRVNHDLIRSSRRPPPSTIPVYGTAERNQRGIKSINNRVQHLKGSGRNPGIGERGREDSTSLNAGRPFDRGRVMELQW